MRSFKTEGIIIRRRNINDADRMLTVLTKDRGKLQIKACGVRKITSRRSAHVELLNHAVLNLYNGPTFIILTEAQIINAHPELKQNLLSIGTAYHICELIDGLCPEQQEQEAVFQLLRTTLRNLSSQNDIVRTTHEFEVRLLTLLGYLNNSNKNRQLDTQRFIETILERKLRSKKFIHLLI